VDAKLTYEGFQQPKLVLSFDALGVRLRVVDEADPKHWVEVALDHEDVYEIGEQIWKEKREARLRALDRERPTRKRKK